MSAWARYIAALSAGLVCIVWAWWHQGFNGANVIVIALLLLAALLLWIREHAEAETKARDYWIDPKDGA